MSAKCTKGREGDGRGENHEEHEFGGGGVRLCTTILLQYITSGGYGSMTLVLVARLVVVDLINDGSWPVCSFVLLLFFFLDYVFGILYGDNFLCHVVRESLNVMMTIYIKHFTNLKAHKTWAQNITVFIHDPPSVPRPSQLSYCNLIVIHATWHQINSQQTLNINYSDIRLFLIFGNKPKINL